MSYNLIAILYWKPNLVFALIINHEALLNLINFILSMNSNLLIKRYSFKYFIFLKSSIMIELNISECQVFEHFLKPLYVKFLISKESF